LPQFYNIRYRIVWSHIENVSSVSEIIHPAVREALSYLRLDRQDGLEIHHQGDLPARAGMGSSSSFSVGLLRALRSYLGLDLCGIELAREAIKLERELLSECVGYQDQVAAACGGFNHISFQTNGEIKVTPVRLASETKEELEQSLMLFYTGAGRIASSYAKKTIAACCGKEETLKQIGVLVPEGLECLQRRDFLATFGALLHQSWILKRSLDAEISSKLIDDAYDTARSNGAFGGKLLGAGGTGFLLICAPQEKHSRICSALREFEHVAVEFENEGCSLIQ
jgi:D-glycero-alpha-D-manno-heptose-7-phosphate kinase